MSVRRSVCRSVAPLVREHESKSVKTRISAPAHPSATGMAVYLFLFHLVTYVGVFFVRGSVSQLLLKNGCLLSHLPNAGGDRSVNALAPPSPS